MSSAAYSDLKAAWHLKSIQQMREGRQIVPHQVHFIISDLCNQDCHFCSYRMSTGISSEQFGEDTGKGFTMNPNRKIPFKKCVEILEDFKSLGVKAVQFTGGGEPTVHPDHLAIFDNAQFRGLETSLVTNGAILRDGWEDLYSKMAWIRVSVDAGRAETYGKIRGVHPRIFHKVLDNISKIVETVPKSCLVGVGYVVTNENYEEIEDGLSLLKATGVPYVRLAGMFSTEGESYYRDTYTPIKRRILSAKDTLEEESFRIVDLFGDRISDLRQHSPDYSFCGYQQFVTYIGGNLKVYRCCSTSYTKHGEIGDLSNQTFRDWFLSQTKKDAIAALDARSCQVCQFNNKNRVVNYMLEKDPTHVEFV